MRRFLFTVATVATLLIPAIAATFTTKLTASDAAPGDLLGPVSIDGNTLVAHTVGGGTGAAYVFMLEGGAWSQQAKLTPPVFDPHDFFARALPAVDGDTIAVGALGDSTFGLASGAVYVFVRDGSTWSLEAKVTAPDPRAIQVFGWSVALSGDTLVVGARNDNDLGAQAGAAYVLTRSGGVWLPEAKLIGSMVGPGDAFGSSVAIDGDTVVVGSVPATGGSAYVFRRSGGLWSEEAWLPSGGAAFDGFGAMVAVQGDTAVVASPFDDTVNMDAGAAYVFERTGDVWTQQAQLLSPTPVFNFGQSVALDGDVVAVGAGNDGAAGFISAGSVAVFSRSGGAWQLEEKITAFDAAATDFFGSGVALQGKTLAVSAPGDDDAGTDAGSIYLYDLDIVTNQPPVAVDDGATVGEGQTVVIDVLANDFDPDGDDISIVSATQGEFGTVEIVDQQINYSANVLGGLIGRIEALPLNRGLINSLLAKVRAAQASFARGNRQAGLNQLGALVNELEALVRGGRLDPDLAGAIIAIVQLIQGGAVTDTFTYTVGDGELTDSATVTVTVTF